MRYLIQASKYKPELDLNFVHFNFSNYLLIRWVITFWRYTFYYIPTDHKNFILKRFHTHSLFHQIIPWKQTPAFHMCCKDIEGLMIALESPDFYRMCRSNAETFHTKGRAFLTHKTHYLKILESINLYTKHVRASAVTTEK